MGKHFSMNNEQKTACENSHVVFLVVIYGGFFMKSNEVLKQKMRAEKVSLWRVAEVLGISEWTLGRWLRHEVDSDLENRINEAIDFLSK